MKYLKISNKGLLDMRLVHLMGGTTKSNDKYKIGQFGTGLKYTLAFMLRNNIDFKIFIDSKEVKLSSKKEVIRNTSFEIIYINGDRTSITTNMGKEWEAWMIVRELWCNALDEVMPSYVITEEVKPQKGFTEYYIQLVPDIQKVMDDWDKYFIHGQEPVMETEDFAIYMGAESLRIYKQGVLISEQTGKSSVFSYDIKGAELNELRETKWGADYYTNQCLPNFDKKTAEIFINNVKGKYEEKMDYSWCSYRDYGEGWTEAIGNGKYCSYETYDKLIDRYPNLEDECVVQIPKGLFSKLIKNHKSMSLVRASDKLNEFYEIYSETLHDKVTKCVKLLQSVGYFIDPNLQIIYGIFGDKQTQAQVSFDDKEIRLSQELENMPDSDLIVCLIEENEHYKTGYEDCTRSFQNHFIKLYTNLLLKDVNVLL